MPEPSRPSSANVVMVGIGGTGVVTTNRILATAALLDGLTARGVDQTGLSQKGGAVVSHLRIAQDIAELPGLVGSGEADAYLVFDTLAAVASNNLKRCSPLSTRAVVSTAEVPTGQMVGNPNAVFPERNALVAAIASQTVDPQPYTLDARAVANKLFGSSTSANVVVLGVAYQLGLFPVTAFSIERALDLNGVGVEMNRAAFRAGRKIVANQEWMPEDGPRKELGTDKPLKFAARRLVDRVAGPASLREILEPRVPELIAFQNEGYAERYVDVVESVAELDRAISREDVPLTKAVARYLFKLMAYKDEYEVARLHLESTFDSQVAQHFGPDAKIRFLLHPPLLRRWGLNRKISLGAWIRPVFRLLVAMRHLRGTRLDLFGFSEMRRLERELVEEYIGAVAQIIQDWRPDRYGVAMEIAELPDMVRGYEEVKVRNVKHYRERLNELRDSFYAPRPEHAGQQ